MAALSVISPGFVLSILAVTLLLWLGFLRFRHRRTLTVAVATVAVLMSLATAADAVNVHFAYLPRLGDVLGTGSWPADSWADVQRGQERFPRGVVVRVPLADGPGGRLGKLGQDGALTYLPPQYFSDSRRRFPVAYLLHGSPGVPLDWLRGARVAETAARLAALGRPVIVVMPRVSKGWLDDSECVDGAHEAVETYLVRRVVPGIDGLLRTRADRLHRVIAGNSSGGYCALNLGLRHRDLFGAILDLSGMDQPTHRGGMPALFGHRPDLALVVRANSPEDYLAALAPGPLPRVWLDCGDRDPVLPQVREMAGLLASQHFPTQLRVRHGAHTFQVWRPGLAASLAWALGRMPV